MQENELSAFSKEHFAAYEKHAVKILERGGEHHA
jgi:hypothetical protein